ncbi:MAG: ATP-binding protein [Candidatus Micrarchaeia archaeon]|jgi:ATP-dependent DNA helicase RecG
MDKETEKMFKNKIESLIKQGENTNIEFKECKNLINKNIYETICAFLNWEGGELLIGVSDTGDIIGVNNVSQLKKDIATTINNPQKLNPAVYLTIDDLQRRTSFA